MDKAKRAVDSISRAFRQDFPQFVDRAKALGVRISLSPGKRNGRARVFWLDGYKQLTGYTTKAGGLPFTDEDAAKNIDKALTAAEEDRAIMAGLTVAERFARVMAEMRQIKPQYRMIGEARLPGGDRAWCFFMAEYDGGVRLHGIGDVAKAKASWVRGEIDADHIARFCDLLEADFERRQEESA